MQYLIMILHGPLQSWGAVNLPDVNIESGRNTYTKPTFSGIVGLLRSALGEDRTREEDEYGLKNIRLLTRSDREGSISRDYTVAERTHHGFRAGQTKQIPKYYLEDATFVLMLGHENPNTIETLEQALKNPQWAPFLGRRAYIPTLPIYLGTVETKNPREYLQKLPIIWDKTSYHQKTVTYTDSFIENTVNVKTMVDYPTMFNPKKNQYSTRTYEQYIVSHQKPEQTPTTIIEQTLAITERITNVLN